MQEVQKVAFKVQVMQGAVQAAQTDPFQNWPLGQQNPLVAVYPATQTPQAVALCAQARQLASRVPQKAQEDPFQYLPVGQHLPLFVRTKPGKHSRQAVPLAHLRHSGRQARQLLVPL